MKIWVRYIIVLSGSLWAISAIIKLCPGDLPKENFCMNDLTPFGVNGLGGRVIVSGLSRKSNIFLSIEGIARLIGLKTSERCCLSVSAFTLSFIARLPLDFLIGKEIVLIFKILLVVLPFAFKKCA